MAQPSGKIVVTVKRGKELFLARLKRSGELDRGFGRRGYASTGLGAAAIPSDLFVRAGGKIDLAAEMNSASTVRQYVIQFNKDGSRDRTFGTSGRVEPFVGRRGFGIGGLAQTPVGNLLVAGVADTPGCALSGEDCRYEQLVASLATDGSPQADFGAEGVATIPAAGARVELAVAPDGRIVTGSRFLGSSFIARLLSDGSLDSSFGSGAGYVETEVPVSDVAVAGDQDIYAGGAAGGLFGATALDSAGSAILSFANGGVLTTSLGEPTAGGAGSLLLQSDGRLLIAGPIGSSCGRERSVPRRVQRCRLSAGVVRVSPSGAVDQTFGRNGVARIKISSDRARFDPNAQVQLANSRDGVRLATPVFMGSREAVAVAALRSNGRLKRDFGQRGRSIVPSGSRNRGE